MTNGRLQVPLSKHADNKYLKWFFLNRSYETTVFFLSNKILLNIILLRAIIKEGKKSFYLMLHLAIFPDLFSHFTRNNHKNDGLASNLLDLAFSNTLLQIYCPLIKNHKNKFTR